MINVTHSLLLIAVVALVTAFLRFLPFVLFRNKTPKSIIYLGNVLPYSIMAMLVVYCLKGVTFVSSPFGIPEALCVIIVVVVHKLKHNTLLSIISGTACYMLLVQLVF